MLDPYDSYYLVKQRMQELTEEKKYYHLHIILFIQRKIRNSILNNAVVLYSFGNIKNIPLTACAKTLTLNIFYFVLL